MAFLVGNGGTALFFGLYCHMHVALDTMSQIQQHPCSFGASKSRQRGEDADTQCGQQALVTCSRYIKTYDRYKLLKNTGSF